VRQAIAWCRVSLKRVIIEKCNLKTSSGWLKVFCLSRGSEEVKVEGNRKWVKLENVGYTPEEGGTWAALN